MAIATPHQAGRATVPPRTDTPGGCAHRSAFRGSPRCSSGARPRCRCVRPCPRCATSPARPGAGRSRRTSAPKSASLRTFSTKSSSPTSACHPAHPSVPATPSGSLAAPVGIWRVHPIFGVRPCVGLRPGRAPSRRGVHGAGSVLCLRRLAGRSPRSAAEVPVHAAGLLGDDRAPAHRLLLEPAQELVELLPAGLPAALHVHEGGGPGGRSAWRSRAARRPGPPTSSPPPAGRGCSPARRGRRCGPVGAVERRRVVGGPSGASGRSGAGGRGP